MLGSNKLTLFFLPFCTEISNFHHIFNKIKWFVITGSNHGKI